MDFISTLFSCPIFPSTQKTCESMNVVAKRRWKNRVLTQSSFDNKRMFNEFSFEFTLIKFQQAEFIWQYSAIFVQSSYSHPEEFNAWAMKIMQNNLSGSLVQQKLLYFKHICEIEVIILELLQNCNRIKKMF
jgi:hypothetical protein